MTDAKKVRSSGAGNQTGHEGMRGGPMGPMGRPVELVKDFKATFKRLIGYLRPRKIRLGAVLILAAMSTIFSIASPKVMGEATTRLFDNFMDKINQVPGAGVDFDFIVRIVMVLAFLYLLSSLFSYAQQIIMASVAQETVYDMRQDVNRKLARLPLGYFDAHPHGDVLSRVTNDIDNIASTLQQSLTQLITAMVTIFGVLVMMLSINAWMTLIFFVVLPGSALVTRGVAKRSQKHFVGQQKVLGELNGHVEEMYTGHQVVKAFGQEENAIRRFNEINEGLFESGWRAQFVSGIIMPLLGFINNIGYVMVCVAGGIFVLRGEVKIGDVQAFLQYTRQFTRPIVQTANIINIIQSSVASAERVFEILDEEEEIQDDQNSITLSDPRGEVEFRGVSFRYRPDVPLIQDMSIKVQPGETIAIVGPTGAGKTTLVNLLMRFYEIDGGQILVDGKDIRSLSRGSLRDAFGMVLQDTWLFNGTIRENIAYGKEGASEEEIIHAARTAHADHFIRTLPDGYNTVLNEEASNLSQGQKQLLTIARAILSDPSILILDEATSSVDTRTEAYIQKGMLALMRKRTSFVIAHRLSTIRDADLILVIADGHLVESGNHETLLARKGFYSELYESQFSRTG